MPKKKRKFLNVTIPGYDPNWKSLIENDPTYQAFKHGQEADHIRDLGYRNSQVIEQLIKFGGDPSLLLGPQGSGLSEYGITPEQIAAAQNNPNSTTNQLAFGHKKNIQDLQDALAARGIIRSGGLVSGLNLEQKNYAAAQAKERQDALDFIAGLQKAFADAEGKRATDLAGEAGNTQGRLQDTGLYEHRDARTVKAFRDPATGLYKDGEGNYYDANGNPTDPASGRIRRRIKRRQGRVRGRFQGHPVNDYFPEAA